VTSNQHSFSGRKGMGAALIFQFVPKEFSIGVLRDLQKKQRNLRMGKTAE